MCMLCTEYGVRKLKKPKKSQKETKRKDSHSKPRIKCGGWNELLGFWLNRSLSRIEPENGTRTKIGIEHRFNVELVTAIPKYESLYLFLPEHPNSVHICTTFCTQSTHTF